MTKRVRKLDERVAIGSGDMARIRTTETLWEHARAINRIDGEVSYLAELNIYTNVQAVTPYRANISGAVTIDLTAVKSNNLHLKLVGNVTSFALTNPIDGAIYSIRFIQDTTGGRTFSGLPSYIKFSGGTAPTFTTTANGVDFLSLQWGSVEATYMGSFLAGMA